MLLETFVLNPGCQVLKDGTVRLSFSLRKSDAATRNQLYVVLSEHDEIARVVQTTLRGKRRLTVHAIVRPPAKVQPSSWALRISNEVVAAVKAQLVPLD